MRPNTKGFVLLYSHVPYNNDTIIKKHAIDNRRNDQDAVINDARRKTLEDFFIKYFTSHFICKVSKRVTQSLRVRRSWRPNITEIFWPRSYGRQRCVFLVLQGCSTGALESTLLGAGFPYYSRLPPSPALLALSQLSRRTKLSSTVSSNSTVFNCSIRRPYITFKFPRLHASAISFDIWRPGCVNSAIFGMACVIVIERK